jgi:hypothetical protein
MQIFKKTGKFVFGGAPRLAHTFGARTFILTEHQPMMDKLINEIRPTAQALALAHIAYRSTVQK